MTFIYNTASHKHFTKENSILQIIMANKAHCKPTCIQCIKYNLWAWERWIRYSHFKSVESAPVAAVAGGQASCYQENEVHKPPDAKTTQGKQLSHRSPSVSETEPINAETSQEKWVQ